MNEQYQEAAEDVVITLKEFYVFVERTDKLEAILELQKASMLKRAKAEAEDILFTDEANKHMKSALVNVMVMSDEEILDTFLSNYLTDYFVELSKESSN